MNENEFVVFNLKDEQYGISITKVNEINRLKEIRITKVPKTSENIEGIINLRGEVIPVLNLRKKFFIEDKALDKESRIIIVNINDENVGILVDKVSNVEVLQETEISEPFEEIKRKCKYVTKIGKKDNRIIFILNINKLLNDSM